MALLINEKTGEKVYLNPHHTFGRREDAVDTALSISGISKIHAVIEYRDDHWSVRDISKNGTWIDRERLESGLPKKLKAKQRIAFAGQLEESWLVENLNAPREMLIPVEADANGDGSNKASESDAILLEKYSVLPSDAAPEKILFLSNDTGTWLLEDCETGLQEPVNHKDTVVIADKQWSLHIPPLLNQTEDLFLDLDQLQEFTFIFNLSQDEETTSLLLKSQKKSVDLDARSHHYLLLHLARQKAEALANGYDPADVGWIDKDTLAKDLGIDSAHLNILIFRSRKQIAECLPFTIGVNQLLERRRGYIRLGNISFEIHKGSQLIHEFHSVVPA